MYHRLGFVLYKRREEEKGLYTINIKELNV